MAFRYLDKDGALSFWTNIKNYILSKIPTKTSELNNDSGFLTQHQSLSNYVTLNSEQTITGKKLFTNSTTKVNSVNTFIGSTLFIDTSASAPRGEFPAEAHRVGRIYIGDSTSYNGAWFIVDPIIDTNRAYYRMVTTNPDNTDSARFSITWDSTETGARCRKNVSTGDLLPYANNTYNLGSNNQKWDIGYIHNLIGSNKENASEDANNYYSTTSGSHMTFYTTTNGGTKLSNVPAAVNTQLESRTIRYLSASDWNVEQICHNTNGLYYRKGNNNGWGDWKTFAFTDSNITGNAATATKVVGTVANDNTGALVQGTMGSNDCFRIAIGGASNAGWAEIATADDANEPIYVRQYKGAFTTLQRTATLLDGSGNTSFPGTVTATTFSGALTGNVTGNCSGSSGSCTGNAATATQFSANTTVALTGDATGTSAGSKKGWSVPVTLANSGVTAGDYGPSANASPSHGGTFSVPYVTVDAKGRVTAASTKTITLPADSNTDTKVTQTVTTGNSTYPVLLCATANATTTGTTTSRFSAGLTVNTRYSTIYMTNKYDTANTKGVRDSTKGYLNGDIIFRCYDASEMGRIHCESSKNGYQQTYMMATNYIKNGAISPEGTATTCYITVRVRDNGSRTIYTDGSWENSLIPYANKTHSLGTSSLQWKNAYAVNFYENGTALSSKYAQVDNISANEIGTTRLLAYEPASASDYGSKSAGTTKPGSSLYDVSMDLRNATGYYGDFNSGSGEFIVTINARNTQSGTWKLLHGISVSIPPSGTRSFAISMWVRIA